jgi:imidazolonepropionase-like amidohydrolase
MTQTKKTAIINANVFDGKTLLGKKFVLFENGLITKIGTDLPNADEFIDGSGCTLLPGLIDAHVHTSVEFLKEALKFGITTELEMMGGFTSKGRELQLKGIKNIADVRSAGMALTPPGGHPDELMPKGDGIPEFVLREMERMTEEEKKAFLEAHEKQKQGDEHTFDVTTIEGAIQFVHHQVYNGADYIKIMIEEGTVLNAPGLPMIQPEVMKAAVSEAHRLGKITIAHVLTAEAAKTAVEIGIDGLAHLFIDRPDWTPELIQSIAKKRIFVTPCLVLNSSIIGKTACHIANDVRVAGKLNAEWKNTLCSCFHTFPEGKMEDNLNNVLDLHKAGVDILTGTDVSVPIPTLGGLAHGVSVHHEMQLLVKAGLSPTEALRAATSVPARRFSLSDRGIIAEGYNADLVLVKGNPTEDIKDTLSIIEVWKDGVKTYSTL